MAQPAISDAAVRISTGVDGLDAILGGGLPGRHVYLVQGEPGTGKTTMSLQFLWAGAEKGERCLYITLSQTRAELEAIARSHGRDLAGIDVVELHTAADPANRQSVFYPVDVDIDATQGAVSAAIDAHRPQRLVYDSLIEGRRIARNELSFHRDMLAFKQLLHDRDVATYLIDLVPSGTGDLEMRSIAHGIFTLDVVMPTYGQARRRIDVSKMRGTPYHDGYHDAAIEQGKGLRVFARVVPHEVPEAAQTELVRSEVETLDAMLGGGLEGGTVTLMIGQSGTGKSTMSSLYAYSALQRDEKVAVFLFEERPETFFRRSEGLGMPLREYADRGMLELYDFNPNEISQGQFSQIAQRCADRSNARVVVIDSLTGYLGALSEPHEAVVQTQALLKYLSRRGVLTILVVAQRGLLGGAMETDLDVSFLGDTVILLRMYEVPGDVRRLITVVKKRHGPHEMAVRQLFIEGSGVRIAPFEGQPPA